MKKGIDVSFANGEIDWEKAKTQTEFAIIRCGYGMDLEDQDDEQYKRNIEECIRLNIPVGVYLYSYADTLEKAKSEAQHVIRLANPYKEKIQLGVWYDTENSIQADIEKELLSKIITTFCDSIIENGYSVGIYSNNNWLNNRIEESIKEKYMIWSAGYGINDGEAHEDEKYDSKNVVCWQYTSNGNIEGIGRCDLDYYYKEIEIETNRKTVEELAREVLEGKYGNGIERRKKLEAEGYNYDEVQNRVNEIYYSENRKTNEQIANDIITKPNYAGYGTGIERRKKLEAEGYNYDEIQDIINKKLLK